MGGVNKQLLPLSGVPVLARSLAALEQWPGLEGIVLVAPGESVGQFRALAEGWGLKKITAIVSGGDNRQQSVYSGLLAVPSGCAYVLVHDGARPLVSAKEIADVIEAAAACGAATLAVPVKDTVKEAGPGGFVAGTPDRSRLWLTLTPQCFSFEVLLEAHRRALDSGFTYTDDASLVEAAGRPVRLVEGSYRNIKITTPEDLAVAEALLGLRDGTVCRGTGDGRQETK
jgi:2-C-methyl-D-erythritol 4-phosphate cytidylyltransferase